MSPEPIVIVGAGISGLAAAYELTKRGRRVRVLEASDRAGGLIRTERVEGFTIEAGPDSILNAKPAALELIRELGLEADVQHVRAGSRAFVLKGRTLHPLPQPSFLGIPLTPEALATYDLLSPEGRARMARERTVPPRGGSEDESVGAFFRRRFGDEVVDLVAQPLLGGIHAGDIDQLSMRSLFPRLLEAERERGHVTPTPDDQPTDVPAHAAGVSPKPRRSSGEAKAGEGGFASLRGGMARLVEALEASLSPGTIEYGQRVESLAETDAACVIIAAHAYSAAALVRPIDARAADLCAQVPYVSTASVALAYPRDAIAHPLNGTGFVVARRHSDARITACTWVSSKWEDRAPEGWALLRAFIGGAHDPGAVDLPDEELVDIVGRDLSAVLGITGVPWLTRVSRWPRAGAQHLVGHSIASRRSSVVSRRTASSSPAAASARPAFPIASPMAGELRLRLRGSWTRNARP